MIDVLLFIAVFIAVFILGFVVYSFGYVHGSQDEASGKLHWGKARWEAFCQKHGRGSC